jgi:hypothetical protein
MVASLQVSIVHGLLSLGHSWLKGAGTENSAGAQVSEPNEGG